MSLEADINTLKRQIKDWEHAFVSENSRAPSRQDVKQNAKVSKLYKVYKSLKAKQVQKQQPAKQPPKEAPKLTKPTQIDIIQGLSDEEIGDDDLDESSSSQLWAKNTELGPTPQAGGRVLSIFDVKMTPPESSPLKDRQARLMVKSPTESLANGAEFKTPTKLKPISQMTPMKSGKKSFMDKIKMVQNSSPIKTPVRETSGTKNPHIPIETPQYLNRNIKKFDISSQRSEPSPFDGSPIRTTQKSSPFETTPVQPISEVTTPTTQKVAFQVSPSPFKRPGFLGAKKLMDIFQEHKEITIDEQFEAENQESEESDDNATNVDSTASPLKRRKAKTQKRTTRRWKMRPNVLIPEDDGLQSKNIHKVLQDINDVESKKLERLADPDASDEEFEEPALPTTITKPTGKKIAPISHNYKRLKIHHKRGNNRFGRRR